MNFTLGYLKPTQNSENKKIIDPIKTAAGSEACVEGALIGPSGEGLAPPNVVIAPVITKSQQEYIEKRK